MRSCQLLRITAHYFQNVKEAVAKLKLPPTRLYSRCSTTCPLAAVPSPPPHRIVGPKLELRARSRDFSDRCRHFLKRLLALSRNAYHRLFRGFPVTRSDILAAFPSSHPRTFNNPAIPKLGILPTNGGHCRNFRMESKLENYFTFGEVYFSIKYCVR